MDKYDIGGRTYYRNISNSHEGTKETLAEMTKLIKSGAKDPIVIEFTRDVIKDVPEKDYGREVNTVFNFVKQNVRYTKDVAGVETLTSPQRMIKDIKEKGLAFGDCDDKSIMLSAMLESVGYPTRLVVTSQNPNKEFGHVYIETSLEGEWVPLDATKKQAKMGWEHKDYTMKMRYSGALADNQPPQSESKGSIVLTIVIAIIGIWAAYKLYQSLGKEK